ncbi:farnesoate epoxidase-like isoform X2 [Galleria mellonella]|uniref:Farnesoate epoxidase-like isoform X2 n=1 Tax=Galleria mellonella TaxID=7137 RepID=A0ABM3MV22_GALME|nr:farnesoate epoxidase-like isoform X2 [Galleria mellonella]
MWLFVICLFVFCYFLRSKISNRALYPPGPPTFPIIGNMLSVYIDLKKHKYHHKVWQSWSRIYGNILGLKFGLIRIVVVSGRELIREVSTREVFDSRPDGFLYTMRSFGKKLGIVFSDGPVWNTTRRVLLKYLKHFGYGTRSMEVFIAEECRDLVMLRISDAGTPVFVNQMFHIPITNILWRIVAGKRHIIPDLIGFTEIKSVHNKLHEFILETIKEHRDSIDINNPRDVIDAFLIEMIEHKATAITEEELQIVCLDMLEAGMETVTNTAIFMLLHLVRNEKVQKRLQTEIDNVVGLSRTPSLDDRPNMVYTEAVLLETLRISSVAAVGIPHMAREDARLGDYLIPKGTYILLAIHDLHNSNDWEDPDIFRPERFLKEGSLIQDDKILAFGLGRRRCIGEGLAKSELFMFMTHLLQKFTLKVPDGDPMPSTDPIDGITLSAKPFRVIFEPRFK